MKNAFSYQFIKFSWLLRHLIRAYVSKENKLYLFAKSNVELLNSNFLFLLFKIIMSLIYPILWIRIYFSGNGNIMTRPKFKIMIASSESITVNRFLKDYIFELSKFFW